MKPKRLGRGLSGLIKPTDESAAPPRRDLPPPTAVVAPAAAPAPSALITEIRPNPYQPRAEFDDAELQDLAASVREHGVLQPLVVRRGVQGYELIAGERRLRAAQLAELKSVPIVLREATDEEMQVLALVENLQRVDLNAIEKARALRSMMRTHGLTQEAVAAQVGKSRATIANFLRLLELPEEVQSLVMSGALGGAHARAILRAKTPAHRLRLAEQAVEHGWSVRELERRTAPPSKEMRATPDKREDPYVADVVSRIRTALGTQVRVRTKGLGGSIEIQYHDAVELDRLLDRFGA